LPDHRATAHAAEEARDHIRRTQRHAFAIRIAAGFGDFVGKVQGQQGFQQADHGHQESVGRDDAEGFQGPGDLRQREGRQATGDVGHVAEGAGWQTEQVHRQAHAEDRHQGRRYRAGEARQQVDNGHGRRHQPGHQIQRRAAEPGFTALEMLQLRQGNDDRQAVDEPEHHRMRHHAHQLAQAQQAEGDHDQPAQQHRCQQIFHAVLHHQRDDHHRHRARRAGDHTGPTAEQGRQGADDKGAV